MDKKQRYNSINFPEAEEFLKGDHPKKLTEEQAQALGQGEDFDYPESHIDTKITPTNK